MPARHSQDRAHAAHAMIHADRLAAIDRGYSIGLDLAIYLLQHG